MELAGHLVPGLPLPRTCVADSCPELGEHEHYTTRFGEPARRTLEGEWAPRTGTWMTRIGGPPLPATLGWRAVPGAPWEPGVREAALLAVISAAGCEDPALIKARKDRAARAEAAEAWRTTTKMGGHSE